MNMRKSAAFIVALACFALCVPRAAAQEKDAGIEKAERDLASELRGCTCAGKPTALDDGATDEDHLHGTKSIVRHRVWRRDQYSKNQRGFFANPWVFGTLLFLAALIYSKDSLLTLMGPFKKPLDAVGELVHIAGGLVGVFYLGDGIFDNASARIRAFCTIWSRLLPSCARWLCMLPSGWCPTLSRRLC